MKKVIGIINGVTRNPEYRTPEPLNLTIYEGEQIALIGDNATGKSRLINILIGRYPLLQNEVHYDFSPSPHALAADNIKYMTFRDSYGESDSTYYYQQRWNQHDIDENTPTVESVLAEIGAKTDHDFRKKLYDLFHLEGLLDKYIISLSSGELRKLQLTKVLLTEPRLLILDNPFIGLDVETRAQLTDLLKDLITSTPLQLILVVNRKGDIPAFVNRRIELGTEDKGQLLQTCKTQTKDGFYKHAQCRQSTVLSFRNVTIRYGSRTILDNINWEVHQGEHWALEGRNGSGKSTLLSLVCADNPQAYACDIELFGHQRGSGESIWEIKKHIGYVSPEMHRAYLKDMPAIDIVASGLHDSVGLYVRPRPEQREQCLLWMQRFGIRHLADRTFLKISSGEQRLCLLARAFVKAPDLLILDEPFHGLDNTNRLLATQIIEDFCTDPTKTLIMVSHYEEELPTCITHRKRLP